MTYLLLAIIFFLLLAMVLSAVVTPLPPTCQHDYELSKIGERTVLRWGGLNNCQQVQDIETKYSRLCKK